MPAQDQILPPDKGFTLQPNRPHGDFGKQEQKRQELLPPFRLSALQGLIREIEIPSPHKIMDVLMWLKVFKGKQKRGIVGQNHFLTVAEAVMRGILAYV